MEGASRPAIDMTGDAGAVERKAGLAAIGGVLGAVAASSCCILPLLLFTMGIGGAWVGNLTALGPYEPIFVAVTLGFLAIGYYLVYRRPASVCAEGAVCRRPI